ncbi:MAG: zinc-binding dehydrogenase [Rhodocyclaceae bacterium]|nr:zinc-binding dehydrogenase [Rhodocyclaceae bacterium]MCA3652695.1 zinc-binding dehydrogenase [Methylobacterium sp.]
MSAALPHSGMQLRSTITSRGELELTLVDEPVIAPVADEVLIRVEATPINPSDQGLLFGAADLSTLSIEGTASRPVARAKIPERAMRAMAGRLDQPMAVGNEGAGVVIAAGDAPEAQALLGEVVAVFAGSMYSQYRTVKAQQCLTLAPGTIPAEAASCFVNPLTALGMTETMRREGHTALVHTAAASNLGQMLNRVCLRDGIALVNIVRSAEQEQLLRSIGASYVCNSSADSFIDDLTAALVSTGATIAFDAIGGGNLASKILTSMEAALSRSASEYSRYGNTVHKQVYIYGALDTGPTEIIRNVGMFWGIGGWLLFPFLERIGPQAAALLRRRVADELKTTFASQYSRQVSLAEVLQPQVVREFSKRATGTKYLINPSLC